LSYEYSNGWFVSRNSWGDKWGMRGYLTMPFECLSD